MPQSGVKASFTVTGTLSRRESSSRRCCRPPSSSIQPGSDSAAGVDTLGRYGTADGSSSAAVASVVMRRRDASATTRLRMRRRMPRATCDAAKQPSNVLRSPAIGRSAPYPSSSARFIAARPASIIAVRSAANASGRKSAIQTTRQRRRAFGERLRAGVVMREAAADDGPGDAARDRIDGDDQLARDHAVGEGDDARARLEPAIGDEARDQPRVQRADVGERVPDRRDRTLDDDFAVNRCHVLPSRWSAKRKRSATAGRRLVGSGHVHRRTLPVDLAPCPPTAPSPTIST